MKNFAFLLFGLVVCGAGAWALALVFPRYLILGILLGLISGGWLVASSADEQRTTHAPRCRCPAACGASCEDFQRIVRLVSPWNCLQFYWLVPASAPDSIARSEQILAHSGGEVARTSFERSAIK